MSEALLLLFVLAFWFVVITIVATILRWRRGRPTSRDVELEELRARYARHEVSPDEYTRRRQDLGEGPRS